MARSAKRPTLDLGSGCDLWVREFEPRAMRGTDSAEPAWGVLSLCPSPVCAVKINKLKNNNNNKKPVLNTRGIISKSVKSKISKTSLFCPTKTQKHPKKPFLLIQQLDPSTEQMDFSGSHSGDARKGLFLPTSAEKGDSNIGGVSAAVSTVCGGCQTAVSPRPQRLQAHRTQTPEPLPQRKTNHKKQCRI